MYLFFETGSSYVVQAGLNLGIFLLSPPKCCEYRLVPPHLPRTCILKKMKGQTLIFVALSGGRMMIIPERLRQIKVIIYLLCIYYVFTFVLEYRYYRKLWYNCTPQWTETLPKCIKLSNGFIYIYIYIYIYMYKNINICI
jgi:hypothetical protein